MERIIYDYNVTVEEFKKMLGL